jgi:hypothetical protein
MDDGPWYRQPWPWIVAAGPAMVVVAGVVTAWIAFSGADALVSDDYYKQGLAINRTLAREQRAQQLGLSAQVSFVSVSVAASDGMNRSAAMDGLLRLQARGRDPLPALLELRLAHPTRPALDRSILLQRTPDGSGYEARVSLPMATRWQASLESPGWRLRGSWSDPLAGELQLLP